MISRLKIFIVPDLTIPGAFDEAVKGVHGILHLATPINFWLGTQKEVIDPAVNGSLLLLESAKKFGGPQLHSFIYISSLVAMLDPKNEADHEYTSESWNTTVLSELQEVTDEKIPFKIIYPASKVLAEQAVFRFQAEEDVSFGVCSILPGVVSGPPVMLPKKADDLNGTIKPIWKVLSGEIVEVPEKVGSGTYVDVRDLAKICWWCLENAGMVDGKRIVAIAGQAEPEVLVRSLWTKYKDGVEDYEEVDSGDKIGSADHVVRIPKFDTRLAEEAVGGKWISYRKTVLDTARMLERYLQ
jgi:nucleoside-diphosphate-sugar epimerase